MPAIALVAVAVWWFGIREDTSTTTTTTAVTPTNQLVEVTSGSMNETVSAEGTVAAAQTDDLSFSSSGTVTAVNVAAGDTVTAGQVLATIDSSELAAAVTSAESAVADAEAKLADDQDADASDEQIAADIAQIATANDTLATATEALAGASLVATFDGTVASVDLTVGEELSSGGQGGTTLTGSGTGSGRSSATGGGSTAALPSANQSTGSSSSTAQIQVVSSGRFEVEVSVDSTDIDSIEVGQTVDVAVTTSSSNRRGGFGGFPGGGLPTGGFPTGGFPTELGGDGSGDGPTATGASGATATGSVTEVSRIADASSGVAAYQVVVSFTGATDQFYVGSSVTADIVTAERTDVLQVPTRAVSTDDTGSSVTVSTDGTADGATETRSVTIGLTASGMTEITSGLKAGEQVVISFPGRGVGNAATGAPTGAPTGAGATGAGR